jgi:hypothetical protein
VRNRFDPFDGPGNREYNRPFLTPALELISGYCRLQGIVYRKGERKSCNASPFFKIEARPR